MQRWGRRNIWGKLVKLRDRPKDLRRCLWNALASSAYIQSSAKTSSFSKTQGEATSFRLSFGCCPFRNPMKVPWWTHKCLTCEISFIKIYPSIFLLALPCFILLIYHLLIFGLNFVKIQLLLFCFIFFSLPYPFHVCL